LLIEAGPEAACAAGRAKSTWVCAAGALGGGRDETVWAMPTTDAAATIAMIANLNIKTPLPSTRLRSVGFCDRWSAP
jgi:hypothetical protein